jgi:hypothetical protein
VKEFVKHVVVQEMEADEAITEEEARQIGQRLRDLGYVD